MDARGNKIKVKRFQRYIAISTSRGIDCGLILAMIFFTLLNYVEDGGRKIQTNLQCYELV